MFRKQVLTTLLLCSLLGTAKAQWQAVPLPISMDLFSVDALDAQHIVIGAASSCLFTADGGATWDSLPMNDPLGFPLLGSAYLAMRYRSTTEVYGTGIYFLDSYPFQVRRSTNGGATWPMVYNAQGNGAFTAMRSMAFWGTTTTGVAVGDIGRILRTTTGTTWSAVSATSTSLSDVAFATATNVVAVGNGTILRSPNAGVTWSSVYSGGADLNAVHFPTASIGFAAGGGGALLQSTNGGATWAALNAAWPETIEPVLDLHFVSAQEGYALTRQRILHTVDGGLHWEWFPCAADMRQLHFISATNGLAVGDDATLYRTGGTGSYRPYAMFDAPSNVACPNASLTFTNQSAPGLSSRWLVNGTLVGTTTDLTYTFTQPQQTSTVALVVSNGTWTDTLTHTVTVGADPAIAMAPQVLRDTVCSGSGTQVTVPASQVGTTFRLFRGTTAQGSGQNGNGNTLTFSTGNITAEQVFHLVASRTVAGCGTNTDTLTFTLAIGNPAADLAVAPGTISVCRGDAVSITLAASQPQVSYQLRRNNVAVGVPQQGTGNTLTFSVGPLTQGGTYTFLATHANGCTSTLQQNVAIALQMPHVAWGATLLNPEVGAPVDLMNSSNTLGGTYAWNFGAGATPTSSTEEAPVGVTFDVLGSHTVQLIGITPQGCRDTLTRVIRAVAAGAVQDCGISQLAMSRSETSGISVAFDPAGNMFGFLSMGSTVDLFTASGAGDTLLTVFPVDPDYATHHVLVKYDPMGRPQWYADFWYDNWTDEGAHVRTDAQGNSYTAFFHGTHLDSLRIIDAARAVRTINPPTSGSYYQSMVVASFDPNGRLRWVNTFLEGYTTQGVNIELDDAGHVYVQGSDRLVKYDAATGEQLWEVPDNNSFHDIVVDATGVWVARQSNLVLERYTAAGDLSITTAPYVATAPPTGLTRNTTALMEGDGTGHLYQVNYVNGTVVVGNDTLVGVGSQVNTVYYITRRSATGLPLWNVPFSMGRNAKASGMAVAGDRILVHIQAAYPDSLRMEGLPVVAVQSADQWVISLGTDGTQPHAALIYRNTGTNLYGFNHRGNSTLRCDAAGERVAMWVPFNSPLIIGDDSAQPVHGIFPQEQSTGNRQVALVYGELDCVLAGGATGEVQPVAQFVPPTGFCAGSLLPFLDLSLGNPTTWQWSFPGGVPPTGASPEPVTTYASAGTYPITLTVTNAAGSSTVTHDLVVDVCTGLADHSTVRPALVPNPAADQVRITGLAHTNTPARCTDAQGRLVWTGTVRAGVPWDITTLPAGAYVLAVEQPDGLLRLPLIIAR